jgi:uncharacterized membrane protein
MTSDGSAKHDISEHLLEQLRRLGERELHVLAHLINGRHVSRDPEQMYRGRLTFGERTADRVASFGGSWLFILIFVGLMLVWILVNRNAARPFDPYPFILLNLVLSCLAALQAPIIMMSQNRQAVTDRVAAQQDYQVNLKAELDILSLHAKLEELRLASVELMAQQERQTAILRQIEASISNRG